MPNVSLRAANEMILHVQQTDSMGRSPEQVLAMEKNELKPPRVTGVHAMYAQVIATECAVYPKVMYRLALKKGVPAGDEVNPSYPMPYDLAQANGISDKDFKVMGKTKDSGGYLIVRHPYQTCLCGVVRPDSSVDLEASKAQEKKLSAAGWVDSLAKLKGLPTVKQEDEFDPIPQ